MVKAGTGKNMWTKALSSTSRSTVNNKSVFWKRRPPKMASHSFRHPHRREENPLTSAICKRVSGHARVRAPQYITNLADGFFCFADRGLAWHYREEFNEALLAVCRQHHLLVLQHRLREQVELL